MKVELDFERATKNTYVYKNDSKRTPVSMLYIAKLAYNSPPKTIVITIEAKDDALSEL